MAEVKLEIRENGKGAFKLWEDGREIGEMDIGILGDSMRVYHTEVDLPMREKNGKENYLTPWQDMRVKTI